MKCYPNCCKILHSETLHLMQPKASSLKTTPVLFQGSWTGRSMSKKKKLPASRRSDIQHIFQCYTSDHDNLLSASGLLTFLHREQMEVSANQSTAEALIDRYEVDESG